MHISYAYYVNENWGVIVKKKTLNRLWKIGYVLPLMQILSTAEAADYTQLFQSAGQSFAHFQNIGENPIRCVVRASVSGICGPGEVRSFETDDGFSYVGPDGKRNKKFTLNNSDNPTASAQHTLPQPEERPLTLAPGEQTDIQLGMLSHFLGISYFQENVNGAYQPHSKYISWDVNERGLQVLLGVARSGQSTIDHTTVKTQFDEKGLPVFISPQHELNWTLDRLKPQKFKIQNQTGREINLTVVLKKELYPWDKHGNLEAQDGYAWHKFRCLNSEGSPILGVQSNTLFKIEETPENYVFQKKNMSLNVQNVYDTPYIPMNILRSLEYNGQFDIDVSGEEIIIRLLNTQAQSVLQKIIFQEFLDSGKKDFQHRNFYEFYDWNALTISEKWFGCHRKFLQTLYEHAGLRLEDVLHKRQHITTQSKQILQQALSTPIAGNTTRIPLKMHKLWLTLEDSPRELPEDRLQHYIKETNKFPDFEHTIWCMDKSKLPLTAHRILGTNIKLRELKEIWPEFRGKDLFYRMIHAKRLVACTDIARINLIYFFGGIYSDFGVEYHISPKILCEHYDFISFRESYLLSGTSIGCTQSNNIADKILEFLDNVDSVPHNMRDIGHNNPLVPWYAYGIITAMFDIYSTPETRYFAIPFSKGFATVNHFYSWGGQTNSFGQKTGDVTEKEYFGADIVSIENGYNYKPDRWDETITHEMSRILYGQTKEQTALKRRQLMETSKATYYQLFSQQLNVIPHISHRCWLTNPNNPFETPTDKLNYYINSCRTLNVTEGWQHYFWCLDPTKIPKTIAYLQQANVGIVIKSLSDIYPSMQARHVFEAYLEDGRYTNANDLSRMEILNIFGGFYCDIGIELNRNLTSIIDSFEYLCLHNRECGHLDLGLIGLQPFSEMSQAYLQLVSNLKALPAAAKAITPSSELQFCWLGCNYWMSYLDSKMPSNTKIFLVEYKSPLINLHRLQSWGTTPSFGNKSIKDSTLNLF